MAIKNNAISQLEKISGIFKVVSPTIESADSGCDYLSFGLKDENGTQSAVAWLGQYNGVKEIEDGMILYVTGHRKRIYKKTFIECTSLSPAERTFDTLEKTTRRLRALYFLLENGALKDFVVNVVGDKDIYAKWTTIPASKQSHHAWRGGLFQHSVDVAWRVMQSNLPASEKETACIAGLLHDIGKIKTHHEDGNLTKSSTIDHEVLGIEILSPHLKQLEAKCEDTAIALRRMLSMNHRRHRNESTLDETILRHSDQASAALSVHDVHGW